MYRWIKKECERLKRKTTTITITTTTTTTTTTTVIIIIKIVISSTYIIERHIFFFSFFSEAHLRKKFSTKRDPFFNSGPPECTIRLILMSEPLLFLLLFFFPFFFSLSWNHPPCRPEVYSLLVSPTVFVYFVCCFGRFPIEDRLEHDERWLSKRYGGRSVAERKEFQRLVLLSVPDDGSQ